MSVLRRQGVVRMRVMVVEDDAALSLFLRKGLELEGHCVECIADGAHALERVLEGTPDLLVLDLGLPGLDGMDVLRAISGRVPDLSVLVLTGRTQARERVECLNLGADDCLVKPFSFHELLVRSRAIVRRRASSGNSVLMHGDLVMDRIARRVTFAGSVLTFTTKEFALLEYLLLYRDRAVSRHELLAEVWKMPADAGTNVVDVYVNYLRRKLGAVDAADMIGTVRGEGYAVRGLRKPPTSVRGESRVSLGAA